MTLASEVFSGGRHLGETHLRVVERRRHGLRSAVVRRVRVGVVAQPGQHGGDFSHVAHHVRGDVAHPRGEGVRVDWLHHLVRGALHPARTKIQVGSILWSRSDEEAACGMLFFFNAQKD